VDVRSVDVLWETKWFLRDYFTTLIPLTPTINETDSNRMVYKPT
jgi:hypothetical protein